VVLAVARAFATAPPSARPARSILFLLVTAEERGLLGSDFFVHHPSVPQESIVANVNVDGALMLHPLHDVVAFGVEHSSILNPVQRAAERLDIALSPDFMPEEVIFIRSDQFSFVKQGIPAVYPFVGADTGSFGEDEDGELLLREWMTTHYHKPSDDMRQEMDLAAGAKYTKLIYLIGQFLATDPEPPTWNEGDFLGEKFGGKS
jgi:Zn-dependent M28 family amino/carboxypeptidase